MSPLISGDNLIPSVAIQPAASPIQLNVTPSAGEPLRGNQLQQLAESLSSLNAGLMQFGQAVVTRENKVGAESGQAFDWNALMADEANQKKSWRELIASTGLPEASNPWFQLEAAKGLGRLQAIQTWQRVQSLRERMSDPVNPLSVNDAFLESLDPQTAALLDQNFYIAQGFSTASQSLRLEVESAVSRELMQRTEFMAGENFAGQVSGAVRMYATGEITEQALRGQFSEAWTGLNSVISNPETQQKLFLAAFGASMNSLGSTRQVDEVVSMTKDLPYGASTVGQNIPLMSQILEESDRAKRAINTRLDDQDRSRERATKDALHSAMRDGMVGQLLEAAARGDSRRMPDMILEYVRRTNLDPAIADALTLELSQVATSVGRLEDTSDAPDSISVVLDKIRTGEIRDYRSLGEVLSELNIRNPQNQAAAFAAFGRQQQGQNQAITATAEIPPSIVESVAKRLGFSAVPFSSSDRRELLSKAHSMTNAFNTGFYGNNLKIDERTFRQIVEEDGVERADALFAAELGRRVSDLQEETIRDVTARHQRTEARTAGNLPTGSDIRTNASEAFIDAAQNDTSLANLMAAERARLERSRALLDTDAYGETGMFIEGTAEAPGPADHAMFWAESLALDPGEERFIVLRGEGRPFMFNRRRDVFGIGEYLSQRPRRRVTLSEDGSTYRIQLVERTWWSRSDEVVSETLMDRDGVERLWGAAWESPLVPVGLTNAVEGSTGNPNLTIADVIRQNNGSFPFASKLIFSSEDEYAEYLDNPAVADAVHGQLGLSDAEIVYFQTAQRTLLDRIRVIKQRQRRQ